MNDAQPGPLPQPETTGNEGQGGYGPFRALRHKLFRRFWIGQVISLTGNWMHGIAQRWLVYELTGSVKLLGIVNALGVLPVALLGPFSGVVADRFEKRRILIWAQIAPTLIALSLWLLVATGWVRVWHVVVFAVGLGTVRMFEIPTRQSFWVEIASKRDLMSAITLNSACVNLTRIIGPSLAGILIARIGTGPCFLVNAVSFLPVLFVLIAMPPSPVAAPTSEPLWVSIRDGLRYMRDNKAVGRLLLLVAAWSLFGSQFDVLLPAVADRVFHVGAKGYGFFTAAMGAGALVGAVVTASLERLGHRGRLVIIGCAIAMVGLVALALARSYAMALVSLVVLGLGMVMQNATSNTLVQSIVPDALRGRVMGVYSLMFIGLAPVGSLFYAFVGEALGLSRALALGAVGFGVSASLLLLPDPAVRRLS